LILCRPHKKITWKKASKIANFSRCSWQLVTSLPIFWQSGVRIIYAKRPILGVQPKCIKSGPEKASLNQYIHWEASVSLVSVRKSMLIVGIRVRKWPRPSLRLSRKPQHFRKTCRPFVYKTCFTSLYSFRSRSKFAYNTYLCQVTVKTLWTKFEIFSSNIVYENTFIAYRVVCADRRTDETISIGILLGSNAAKNCSLAWREPHSTAAKRPRYVLYLSWEGEAVWEL
jgi:hypothetical protein